MLRGHPGNIARAVRRIIVRGVNHGLIVTFTTDGSHAPGSWHKILPPRNLLGRAVDLGVIPLLVGTAEARRRLVAFQAFLIDTFGPGTFHELFGPDNSLCVKNGVRITLLEGSDLEDMHDNHVHVAPRRVVRLPRVPRDVRLAIRAHRHGARDALAIIRHARRADLGIATALAVVEQESSFRNVWGGDTEPNGGTTGWRFRIVNRRDVVGYLHRRGAHGEGGMQGCGRTQLTFWSLQDEAMRLGGLWKRGPQLRVAFAHVSVLIDAFGLTDGLRRYNGSGPAADRYSREVRERRDRWRDLLDLGD